jgi:hypothetical protein
VLGLGRADADDLYAAMDWQLPQHARIEQGLARRHLTDGGLVLYDLTSTYFAGRQCPLARYGHSRKGRRDKLQIVFGLLTNGAGCPVAVEVFAGNVGDPTTLPAQIQKLRTRFGIARMLLVGDRGMLTEARLRADLQPIEGLDWVTALRAPAIQALVTRGAVQLSLFEQQDLVEITHPDYPGERLIVGKNPFLAEERTRTRRELLAATERDLAAISAATQRARWPLRGQAQIAIRGGKVFGCRKMGKHFTLEITETGFRGTRGEAAIAREAALDGVYVLRTSVDPAAGEALRRSVVAPAQRSPRATAKALTKRPVEGAPGAQLPDPCWPTWQRSPRTACSPKPRAFPPSRCSRPPPRSSSEPSHC